LVESAMQRKWLLLLLRRFPRGLQSEIGAHFSVSLEICSIASPRGVPSGRITWDDVAPSGARLPRSGSHSRIVRASPYLPDARGYVARVSRGTSG
jgi:hypothetical protein